MSAVYYSFARVHPLPDNLENKPIYDRFECSICRLEAPRIKGGLVYHEAIPNSLGQASDGKTHPAHRDCVLINFAYSETCANCRAPLDPSQIMGCAQKASVALQRLPARMVRQAAAAYRAYCQSKPWQKHLLGTGLFALGIFSGKIVLLPLASIVCSHAFAKQESDWNETARKAWEMASTARKWLTLESEKKQAAQAFSEQSEALAPALNQVVEELKRSGDPFQALPLFTAGQRQMQNHQRQFAQVAEENEPNLEIAAEKVSAISWSAWEAYASCWGYRTGKWFMNAATTVFGIHIVKSTLM